MSAAAGSCPLHAEIDVRLGRKIVVEGRTHLYEDRTTTHRTSLGGL